jgi:hypothetical protein
MDQMPISADDADRLLASGFLKRTQEKPNLVTALRWRQRTVTARSVMHIFHRTSSASFFGMSAQGKGIRTGKPGLWKELSKHPHPRWSFLVLASGTMWPDDNTNGRIVQKNRSGCIDLGLLRTEKRLWLFANPRLDLLRFNFARRRTGCSCAWQMS